MSRAWRCGPYDLLLSSPLVMGVLNLTPDSFSDGGSYLTPAAALARGREMIDLGAAIIDVGGESTRPGAAELSDAAETDRIRAVIAELAAEGHPVSVDTRHAAVARACVAAGAAVINDVSGFRDPAMIEVAATCDAGLVVMHMRGEPSTMQDAPTYRDVVSEVAEWLDERATTLEAAGVASERIAIDPGIGFGKLLEHNLALLRGLPELAELGYPVVVGPSRKRFIGEITGESRPSERLGGSVAAAVEAARGGAAVLRVHDVAETVQALAVAVEIWATRERA